MRGRAGFAITWAAAATALWAQTEAGNADGVLRRFRTAIEETVRRLPDYTCLETIQRSRRTRAGASFEALDTIRVQVGLIGGRERYAWPDASRFGDRELRQLVGRGIIGTGNFAGHVRHIFLSPATRFTPRGAESFRNRAAARFDYEVPVEYSRYKISVPPEEAEVGVRGSFRVDPESLDLLGLEVHAEEIPPELGMSRLSEVIAYDRILAGDSDALLATSAELTIVALDGAEYRNQITFAECSQFRASSTIRFDGEDAAATEPASPRQGVSANLPAALLVDLTLDADLDPATAALGDSVRAVVARPVRDGEQTIVPEGSIVHGRVVRLERAAQPFDHYVVGLAFHTLETAEARFDFRATMQGAGPASGLLRQAKQLAPVFTRKRSARLDILVREKPRGEGVLLWDARQPLVRRGLKMRWRTIDSSEVSAGVP